MRVVGTAGHIDHGKSTLVRALTGIDPDRLQEEKTRGMTIDLGFAWVDLQLPDSPPSLSASSHEHASSELIAARENLPMPSMALGNAPVGIGSAGIVPVGIVDVPGHIDFIKNMLAGIGGIDAALLVVAADEGVMPQTREHLAILDLLDAPRCVVALTKIDLVDEPEWLDLVELDIEELLAETRFGAEDNSAPIVRVSATTGTGLDTLKDELGHVLSELAPRRNRNRPRLPVDRVFTRSGFGAVVTGTLLDGDFALGDEVIIYPGAQPARIRGMQSHKQPVERAAPGSRVALNLGGIDTHEIHRGDVVAQPDALEPTLLIDVEFRLLPSAARPLRHNQAVDFFCGASERRARVRLLGAETLEPGARGMLQLRFEQLVPVVAGDRFILRQPSPSATIGGGQILHVQPRRRWKRFDPAVLARFEQLAQGAPENLLLEATERHPLSTGTELIDRATLDAGIGQNTLAQMRASGALVTLTIGNDTLYYTLNQARQLVETSTYELARYHRTWPLRRGMPQGELRSRLAEALGQALPARLLAALLAEWQEQGAIKIDAAFVALTDHQPTPSPTQQQLLDKVLAAFEAQPYAPPNEGETLALLQNDEELLAYLIDTGVLVRLGQGVLLQTAVFDRMTRQVIEQLQVQGTITLADVRDRFATSRRYAQALLEEMDARRLTRREGDARVLRNPPSSK